MKKIIVLTVLTVMAVNIQATPMEGRYGLIFNLTNLLASIESYNDGFYEGEGGMGLKYWLTEKIALRGLISLSSDTNTTVDPSTTETRFGLGVTGEYHPVTGEVSPYFGGLLGIKTLTNDTGSYYDYYFGGIFGGELIWKKYLSVYAEYALTYGVDNEGSHLSLSAGNNAQVGIILYFK